MGRRARRNKRSVPGTPSDTDTCEGSQSELLGQAVAARDAEWDQGRSATAKRDDDVGSVATSAVTIESTQHLRERREQRDINKRELQEAIKHGVYSKDAATGHLHYFHKGICFVTDSTGKVGITSWVEDDAEAAVAKRQRPAKLWFMHCSGQCRSASCTSGNNAAATEAAGLLLQSELKAVHSFRLLSLSSWEYSPSSIQPDEELAVVLDGEKFDLSPLCSGSLMRQCSFLFPKHHMWLNNMKFRIPNSIFSLAMRLRLGAPARPGTAGPIEEADEMEEATDETTPAERAERHRAAGNEASKAKIFSKAQQEFSAAIKLEPSQHLAYANRAECHLQLGQLTRAGDDALACIILAPTFIKGHYRFCMAALKLDLLDEALHGCSNGLRKEPDNAAMLELLKDIATKFTKREIKRARAEGQKVTVDFQEAVEGFMEDCLAIVRNHPYEDPRFWNSCFQARLRKAGLKMPMAALGSDGKPRVPVEIF